MSPRNSLATTAAASQRSPGIIKREVPSTVGEILEWPGTIARLKEVSGRFLDPERLLRISTQAVRKTPLLAKCDPLSFLGALMTTQTLELEPNTPLGHAYLIPYKNRRLINGAWVDVYEVQWQAGYRGFIELMYRSGFVKEVIASAVHAGDTFDEMRGTETYLRHKISLTEERGELVGSYCFTRLQDGQTFTVLPLAEIEKIRSKSQTYTTLLHAFHNETDRKKKEKAEQKFLETPWVLWEDDMASKSAVKKHAKMMKLSPEAAAASDADDAADLGNLDLKIMADPEAALALRSTGSAPREEVQDETRPTLVTSNPPQRAGRVQQTANAEGDPEPPPARPTRPSKPTQQRQAVTEQEQDEPPPPEAGDGEGEGNFDPETGEVLDDAGQAGADDEPPPPPPRRTAPQANAKPRIGF